MHMLYCSSPANAVMKLDLLRLVERAVRVGSSLAGVATSAVRSGRTLIPAARREDSLGGKECLEWQNHQID